MHINIEEINRKDFKISERSWNGKVYFLIVPKKSKHKWALDELHLRSLLLDTNGNIVSASLPKFFNLFENPEHDKMFEGYLDNGEVRFAEKMDGSLIIRSVIDGHVNFRTRGSHVLADGFGFPVMELVREKYPALLDASLFRDKSLLFEYTSPNNRIVLEYREPALTFLGYMNLYHDETLPKFFGFAHLIEKVAETTGTRPVQFHDLPMDINALRAEIAPWIGSEGIVAWCGNGAMLIKIKADEYLRIHRLKFHLSEDRVRKIAWFADLNSVGELRDFFFARGLDWESASFAEPFMTQFLEDKQDVVSEVTKFLEEMEERQVAELPTRKGQARVLKELSGSNRKLMSVGFKYLDGGLDSIKDLIAARVLKIPVNGIEAARLQSFDYIDGDDKGVPNE